MRPKRGTMQVVVVEKVDAGAEGGSRTRTSFRTTDFKSAASAIPPPRHVGGILPPVPALSQSLDSSARRFG